MAREKALRAVESASSSCGQVNPGRKDWWPKVCFFLKDCLGDAPNKSSEKELALQ